MVQVALATDFRKSEREERADAREPKSQGMEIFGVVDYTRRVVLEWVGGSVCPGSVRIR